MPYATWQHSASEGNIHEGRPLRLTITPDEDARVTAYSIGHSNHSIGAFLAILERPGITSLVDVSSAPYSRYAPHFNRPELEDAMDTVEPEETEWKSIRPVSRRRQLSSSSSHSDEWESDGY
ncbi:MAG: DUF488 family protein [Ktedonobacterales bacterium]